MVDVSDGLLADLGHLARASGVGIDVCTDRLTVSERLVDVAAALGADPLDWVLAGARTTRSPRRSRSPPRCPRGGRGSAPCARSRQAPPGRV